MEKKQEVHPNPQEALSSERFANFEMRRLLHEGKGLMIRLTRDGTQVLTLDPEGVTILVEPVGSLD